MINDALNIKKKLSDNSSYTCEITVFGNLRYHRIPDENVALVTCHFYIGERTDNAHLLFYAFLMIFEKIDQIYNFITNQSLAIENIINDSNI